MDAPICRLCGKAHWSHEDHIFDAVSKPPKVVVNKPVLVVNSNPVVANKSRTQGRHKDKDSRRTYMRDYMRRKRHKNSTHAQEPL